MWDLPELGDEEEGLERAERYLHGMKCVDVEIRVWIDIGTSGKRARADVSEQLSRRGAMMEMRKRIKGYIPPRPDPSVLPD